MHTWLPICFAGSLALAVAARAATEFNWPGRGVISFDVPPNWTLEGAPKGDFEFYFRATTKARNQAVMQISVFQTRQDRPARAGELPELLRKSTEHFRATSVEKKVTPRGMLLAQGTGFWAEFTDARLVGKPPIPGDYKVTRSALIALDDHALVNATMQFDSAGGSEPAAMLGILSGMRLKRGPAAGPATSTLKPQPLEFTVPGSKVRLVFGLEGLDRELFHRELRSNESGRFSTMRPEPNLNLSGWLEPASLYPGLANLWAKDTGAMAKDGILVPRNVVFGRHGKWEIVSFDFDLPGSTNCHVRAQLVSSGTWIDIHLSSVSDKPRKEAQAELLEALDKIQVELK